MNKIESIMDKDLSIRYNTIIVDDEDNEKEVPVFKLKRQYSKISSAMMNKFLELLGEPEDSTQHAYNIQEDFNINHSILKEEMDMYDGSFCFDLDILSNDKKIGSISLTRVFVDNCSDVIGFIDCESPQSMDIAEYICNVDYKKVYDTYVAIYDCFTLDEEFQGIGVEEEIIRTLDSFLIEQEFEISKTYIKAISISTKDYGKDVKSDKMLDILKNNEYVLGDSTSYIMYSDFYDFDLLEEYEMME